MLNLLNSRDVLVWNLHLLKLSLSNLQSLSKHLHVLFWRWEKIIYFCGGCVLSSLQKSFPYKLYNVPFQLPHKFRNSDLTEIAVIQSWFFELGKEFHIRMGKPITWILNYSWTLFLTTQLCNIQFYY